MLKSVIKCFTINEKKRNVILVCACVNACLRLPSVTTVYLNEQTFLCVYYVYCNFSFILLISNSSLSVSHFRSFPRLFTRLAM
jgi:hypothetical protein